MFLAKRVDQAIENLREFCPGEGAYLCNSFGKDSGVLDKLAELAGIKTDGHFHRTSLDPPELIRFGKEYYPDVTIEKPSASMFKLILEKGCPPLRNMRYCCRILKESHGAGRVVLTGTRREESKTRWGRQLVSQCPRLGKVIVNPLVDWSIEEIWDFIHTYSVPYSDLYRTFKRLGCIMCPVAYFRTRLKEAERWPKFFRLYLRCFDRLAARELTTWDTGEAVMRWWLEEGLWKERDHKQFERILVGSQ